MELHTKAIELHEQGFAVIPTGAKKNGLDVGWQKMVGENRQVPNGNFTQSRVKGIGVITGTEVDDHYLLAIDVDCYDKEISLQVCSFICELCGFAMAYRVGERPKFLVPVLCDEQTRKITSASFGDSKIEVLGLGQQFVAYGEHAKSHTGQYQWYNAEFNVKKLPLLSLDKIKSVIGYFEGLCRDAGMEVKTSGSSPIEFDPDDFMIGVAPPREGLSIEALRDELMTIDPNGLEYENNGWIEVAMALHHETGGSIEGYRLWVDWSRQSDKHGEKIGESEMYRKWESFNGEKSRYITVGLIHKLSTGSQIDQLDAELPIEAVSHSMDRFVAADNLLADGIIPPEWVIKNILERDSLAMIYGASGSGKSYCALWMAVCVALGLDFHGNRCKPRNVVYMCGEGYRGVKDRLRAIQKHYNLPSLGNLYLSNRITDFSSADDIRATVTELAPLDPELVIVDTLARASGAFDENSTGDMNRFIRASDFMRKSLNGASLLTLHHSGKGDTSTARGSSVLRAAMDVEIIVEAVENGFTLSSTKTKDGEPFAPLGFRFQRVNFGVYDEDGDELYSHVVIPDQAITQASAKIKNPSPSGKKVIKAFETMWDSGEPRVPAPAQFIKEFGLDAPTEGFWIDDLRDHFKLCNSHLAKEGLKSAFKRGMDNAIELENLAVWDDVVVKL